MLIRYHCPPVIHSFLLSSLSLQTLNVFHCLKICKINVPCSQWQETGVHVVLTYWPLSPSLALDFTKTFTFYPREFVHCSLLHSLLLFLCVTYCRQTKWSWSANLAKQFDGKGRYSWPSLLRVIPAHRYLDLHHLSGADFRVRAVSVTFKLKQDFQWFDWWIWISCTFEPYPMWWICLPAPVSCDCCGVE